MSRRTAASPIFSQDILLHRLIEGQVASTSRARITVTPTPAWLRDPHLAADLLNRRAAVSLSQGKRNQPFEPFGLMRSDRGPRSFGSES